MNDLYLTVHSHDGRLTFTNAAGKELFSEEELVVNDRIEDSSGDMLDVTDRDVANLTDNFHTDEVDIRDRDTLSRIDGHIPTIPKRDQGR